MKKEVIALNKEDKERIIEYSKKIYDLLSKEVPKRFRREVLDRTIILLDYRPSFQDESTLNFLVRKEVFNKSSIAAGKLAKQYPTARDLAMLADAKSILSIRCIGPVTIKKIYEALHEDGLTPNWQP